MVASLPLENTGARETCVGHSGQQVTSLPRARPGSVCDHLMGHSGKLVCRLLLWPERAVRCRVSSHRHFGGRTEGRGLGLSQSQGTLRS